MSTHVTPSPRVVTRAAQPYVGTLHAVTMQTISDAADRIPEIIDRLAQRGVSAAGAPFLRYRVIDTAGALQLEAGVPIAQPAEIGADLSQSTLPAGRYAEVTHRGPFDRLPAVTAGLLDWAERENLAWDMSPGDDGEHWACRLEMYLTNPAEEPDPANWETVVAIKLAD
jgi:effector-binding domain-containing protein